MPELEAVLRRPFAEQVAAWRLRLRTLAPTAKWDDLWQAEHDRAFMVAGALKADLLSDLAAAVDRAITEGRTLEDFRKDFRAIVEKNGWHGWTGEGTAKGEAWRTKVIYRTNIATSYAAGRRAQLMAPEFEYWIYRHSGAEHPRLDHLSWNGLVLPKDHPFWSTHFPPNGWGCGCQVYGAMSLQHARRKGGNPNKDLPDGWERIDPRTGAPRGIDRGWDYAPGASASEVISAMASKAPSWDYNLATGFMRDVPASHRDALARAYRSLPSVAEDLRRYAERVMLERSNASIDPTVRVEPLRTLGLATSEQISRIEEVTGSDLKGQLFDFVVDQDGIRHVMGRHTDARIEATRGQRPISVSDFARLAQLLSAPDNIEPGDVVAGRGKMLVFSKRFGSEWLRAVFEVRTGRRRLVLVTMVVKVSADASPTFTP